MTEHSLRAANGERNTQRRTTRRSRPPPQQRQRVPMWIRCLVAVVLAAPLAAQAPARTDIIRGRVVGPDTMPVAGAQVVAIDTVAKVPKPTRTDARGAFSIS